MELVQLFRLARRRWLALLAGIVLAVVAAVAVGGAPPTASTLAWTRVALDTPASELVKSAPSGYDTLPWRGLLLSHLMLTDATQRELAQRMRVPQNEVAVVDTEFAIPEVGDMVALKATDASLPTGALYVVTVNVPNVTLPVISIEAMAPDRSGAARLAQAAVAVLRSRASPGGTYTSKIRTNGSPQPRLQPFVVQQVAPVRVKHEVKSSLPTKGVAAALFVFVAWLAGVRILSRLVRRRRPRLAPAA
jgi:hypothetical protein